MKLNRIKILVPVLVICLHFGSSAQTADDSLGNPADQFSLQGALEIFKQSSSPENFEELLNKSDNAVNNLDLNQDGEVDYIKVIDKQDGNVHAIVLQVPVNEKENQDIAVIEIEKTGAEEAILQIIGDEDIFGEARIVEPSDEKPTADVLIRDSYSKGPFVPMLDYSLQRVGVNVWIWPSVRFIYRPGYTIWISPYRWGRRPLWYRPWKPLPYYSLRPKRLHFYQHYSVVTTYRISRAHHLYGPHRMRSVTVRTHNRAVIRHNNSGRTYDRSRGRQRANGGNNRRGRRR